MKKDVSKMKSKLNFLKSELQVSKNVTDNLTKYVKSLELKYKVLRKYINAQQIIPMGGVSGDIRSL